MHSTGIYQAIMQSLARINLSVQSGYLMGSPLPCKVLGHQVIGFLKGSPQEVYATVTPTAICK